MTKREFFAKLVEVFSEETAPVIEGASGEEVLEFLNKEIESLDKKAEKAKEKAAEKKAAGDELRTKIEAILEEAGTFLTIAEIVEKIGDSEVTPSKVVARLTQLVKLEKITKDKNKDKKAIYAIAGTEVESTEAEAEEAEAEE